MQEKPTHQVIPNKEAIALDTIANLAEKAFGEKGDTFSEMQDQLMQLEKDLKYVTGTTNKADIADRIKVLKSRIAKSDEAKVMHEENYKNFESGMSFSEAQQKSIASLRAILASENSQKALDDNGVSYSELVGDLSAKSDLEVKNIIDIFVKRYRSMRNDFSESGYHSNYKDLDNAVLVYEKAFGVKGGPLVNESLVLEKEKQRLIKEIQIIVDSIKKHEAWLSEAKANARKGIFGVNKEDKSNQHRLEIELAQEKEKLMLYVQSAMRDIVGVDLQDIGFQYFLRK